MYVHEGYFAAMNQPVLEGREFSIGDRQSGRRVAVVSEALGRFLAGDGTAVGRLIRNWTDDYEIVGVAADLVRSVSNTEPFTLYLPDSERRNTGNNRTLVVQAAAANPRAAMRAVSAAVAGLNPEVVVDPMQTLDEQLLGQMAPQQFGITVLGGLGAIAVLLTGVGVYVLAASISNGRRRELGIRAALGAGRRDLGSVVLGETLRLAGLGVLAGLFLSWVGADLIRALLFGVTPLDVPTFAVISGLMLLVALLASLRPTVAAMRVDPSRTLREE
jgi:ABC-type antimicrobial peptide transport system permease subunit